MLGYIAVNSDSEEEREDTSELGFAMLNEYRHNGYMYEAIQAVLKQLTEEGISFVWACSFEANDASYNLIKKSGFELVNIGKFEVDNDREYDSYEFRIKLN
ncbi:MAG: GNAT family N-acetyltransferase [Candidatus Izemoplasmatales bacterium]